MQNKVLYVALPWEYYATFYVDSWTTASTDEQAQGFAYKQTVYPSKKISVAPTLTANSMFLSLGSTNKTGVFATDVILADSMDKINARPGLHRGRDHHGAGRRKAQFGRCDELVVENVIKRNTADEINLANVFVKSFL